MTDSIRVFVNDRAVPVSPGTSVLAAVRTHDAALAERLAAGAAYVTDGRGLPLAPDTPLGAGAILRVIVAARRAPEAPDADA